MLTEHGIANAFVQDNKSFSAPTGAIRGLHIQVAPNAQDKLIRVLASAILDVTVDIRSDSATYGRHDAVRLDVAGGEQLFMPTGFAHGSCILESNTMVAYKVDAYYSPADDRNLR